MCVCVCEERERELCVIIKHGMRAFLCKKKRPYLGLEHAPRGEGLPHLPLLLRTLQPVIKNNELLSSTVSVVSSTFKQTYHTKGGSEGASNHSSSFLT